MMAGKKKSNKKKLGAWGEEYACTFLNNEGIQIVERNARTPYGEIDIVGQQNDLFIFVEVKTRSSMRSGYPEDAITTEKIRHMDESINWYLENHPEIKDQWRVDVISVVGKPGSNTPPKIQWWQNDF